MRALGLHYNLAPVIDINSNPDNPDIGRQQRAWSVCRQEIEHNAQLVGQVARAVNLGLCVKHFPGIGGSTVNSHDEVMDLTLDDAQLELFYRWARELHGEALFIESRLCQAVGYNPACVDFLACDGSFTGALPLNVVDHG